MKVETQANAQFVDELRSEEYAKYLENHNAPQMRLPKNLKEVGSCLTQKQVFDSGEYFRKKEEEEKYQQKLEDTIKEKLRQTELQAQTHANLLRPGAPLYPAQSFDSGVYYKQVSLATKEVDQKHRREGIK